MDSRALQESRKKLKSLIRQLSYREGDFTLASGQKSRFYIDLKPTALHPEGASLLGQIMAQTLIDGDYPVDAVGGLTLGADPMATAVSLAAFARGKHWPAFIVRKEPKSHGISKWVEGVENLKPGARVVVLEDVITTGGSSLKAVERLRESGYDPVLIFGMVDRKQGGPEAAAKAGLKVLSLFTIDEIQAG
jgi:orotate phosphoribosyltransferase